MVEIGPVVLARKLFHFRWCIFAFSLLTPVGKGQGPSFYQNWFPFTQGCFVPKLVKVGPVILEKKIFEFRQCIFAILLFFPFGKGRVFYLNKLDSPSPKDALCQLWSKFAHCFWRRGWKCKKKSTDRRTDNRRLEKLTWAFSPGELKTTTRSLDTEYS